ncbi:MAG: YbjN domain-containing protein [Clostridia bacterium]|nr:YbjN domain-containing protein [Clostridia bacterium]
MQNYLEFFTDYMDDHGIKYTQQQDNVLKVSYGGDNLDDIHIFVIFDQDGDPYVQFRCWNIANFKNKKDAAVALCNELNSHYRWVKFYIDDDADVIASIDTMIDSDNCGFVCHSMVSRLVSIIDGAYPQIAKARWA